jgi:large subunit ribosomal protein L25
MNTVNVTATSRTDTGKKSTKAVRNSGGIPCVMYGGKEVVHFTTTHNAVKSLIYTPDFKVAEIDMDGSTQRAIVKTAQFHPVTEKIMHIDFLRLIDGIPVNLELPVKFEGSSPGVKLGGK